jgi:hypothetical protein
MSHVVTLAKHILSTCWFLHTIDGVCPTQIGYVPAPWPAPRSPRFKKYQRDVKQAAKLLKNARQNAFKEDGFFSESTRNRMHEELKCRNDGMVAYEWQLDVAILMFHFTLVHVPGTHHTPDGLSRRKPQPGDDEEPEDDFEDWIDNVNGFLHFLNPHPSTNRYLTSTPTITLYVLNDPPIPINTPTSTQQSDDTSDPPIPYSTIPRLDSAIEADRKLEKVQTWLETLERPP